MKGRNFEEAFWGRSFQLAKAQEKRVQRIIRTVKGAPSYLFPQSNWFPILYMAFVSICLVGCLVYVLEVNRRLRVEQTIVALNCVYGELGPAGPPGHVGECKLPQSMT